MAAKDKKDVVIGCATYEGETKNGMKHGMGTLTWDDGDQYVGEFRNDEKTLGTFRWRGGDTYTGEWKQSLMHGKGTYTYKNKRTYEGEWVAGYKQGFGKFTWPIGDRYIGQFQRDQCHGTGVMEYADGRCYKGHWAENKKHGFGTMTLPNRDKIQGQYVENSLRGMVIYTEANGDRFEEFYKEGGVPEGPRKPLKRKDADIQTLLSTEGPPAWALDSDHKQCYLCNTPFTLVNRRHHCRHCGLIFCGNCTSKKITVTGKEAPDRVCDECFLVLSCTIEVPPFPASGLGATPADAGVPTIGEAAPVAN